MTNWNDLKSAEPKGPHAIAFILTAVIAGLLVFYGIPALFGGG